MFNLFNFMRMKKLMIFAVAAIAAIACSRTYDTAPASEKAIGFGTWTETLTKARVQADNTFTVGDNFAVYGAKLISSTPTTVFDDDVVTMTAAGTPGTWTYTNTRYWDRNADSYVFYAISPASIGTAGTVNPQTGVITSAAITFAGNDNDILVADKETVAKAQFGNQVGIDFNHVASLVDIKVSKASTLHDAVVKVTAFSLSNIESAGVLSVDDAYNATNYGGTNGPVVTWSSTATASYLPANGVVPVKGDDSNDISAEHPLTIVENTAFTNFDGTDNGVPAADKATFVINHLVVKPQTFGTPTDATDFTEAKQQLSITYTSKLWLSNFDLVNDNAQDDTKVASWDTGKHYTFYITLDSTPITFGATINDWTTGNGYHYILN